MNKEEEIELKNQLVNAFIQGVEWWEWAVGDGGKLGPKNMQTAREVALTRLREGSLGREPIDVGDYSN